MSLSLVVRRARLLDVRDAVDAGGPGVLQLCDGEPASTPEADPGAAVIVAVPLASVSFTLHSTDASMSLVPAQGYASRMGTPTWARLVSAGGSGVYVGTAGPPGSGAAFIVTNGDEPPSAQMYTGGEVNVTATFLEP